MEFTTQRLILRPITPHDVDDVFAYSVEPQVGPNAGWTPHISKEETLEIITEVLGKEGVYGIVIRESGRLVGSLGLIADPKRDNPHCLMLGYAMSQRCWGHGYMTEGAQVLLAHGFDQLGLSLVSAYCYPENVRSARVLEKCGFRDEGLLRASTLYNDIALDERCFSLTPDEFRAHLSR